MSVQNWTRVHATATAGCSRALCWMYVILLEEWVIGMAVVACSSCGWIRLWRNFWRFLVVFPLKPHDALWNLGRSPVNHPRWREDWYPFCVINIVRVYFWRGHLVKFCLTEVFSQSKTAEMYYYFQVVVNLIVISKSNPLDASAKNMSMNYICILYNINMDPSKRE